MIIRSIKKINKIKTYTANIPTNYQYKLLTKLGSYIKKDEKLAYGEVGDFVEVNLNTELTSYNFKKDKKYVAADEGEIILQGTPLFKKDKILGTMHEEVLSPTDGVVRLDELNKGVIKIVGQKKKQFLLSPVSGNFVHLRKNEFIVLEIDALQTEYFKSFNINETIQGEVVSLKEFTNIKSDDVKDKVVIFQSNLNIIGFEKLIALGCKAIITHNFNLEAARDLNRLNKFPLVIVNQFGGETLEEDLLPEMDYIFIDSGINSLVFQDKKFFANQQADYFSELKVGDCVKIVSGSNWGTKGTVIDLLRNSAKIEVGIKALEIPYNFLIKVQ